MLGLHLLTYQLRSNKVQFISYALATEVNIVNKVIFFLTWIPLTITITITITIFFIIS